MDSLSLVMVWLRPQKLSCNPTGMDKWSPNLNWNPISPLKWAPLIWSHLLEWSPSEWQKGSTSTPKNVNLQPFQNGSHNFRYTTKRQLFVCTEVDLQRKNANLLMSRNWKLRLNDSLFPNSKAFVCSTKKKKKNCVWWRPLKICGLLDLSSKYKK